MRKKDGAHILTRRSGVSNNQRLRDRRTQHRDVATARILNMARREQREEEVNLPGAELCPGMALCLPMAGVDICSHSTRLSGEPMSPGQRYKTPPLHY